MPLYYIDDNKLKNDGINEYSRGPMYTIKQSELSFDALKVKLTFSKDENIHTICFSYI